VAGGSDVIIMDSDRVSRLKELCGEHAAEWFNTYSVTSGRPDRAHFYYLAAPEVLEFGNRKYEEPGIGGNIFEIKGRGAQATAEGSIHPDTGETYRITQDLPLIPFPLELLARLREVWQKSNPTGKREWNLPVHDGEGRDDFLIQQAGRIRHAGASEAIIRAHLGEINEDPSIMADPKGEEDLDRIARSAARYDVPEPVGEVVIGKPAEPPAPVDWRTHYHTREETEHAPKPEFLIQGFLQRQAIVGLAGFVGQKKSLIAQNMAYSLCSGEPLFGCFPVLRKPARVLYLCPEMALIGFANRITRIGLLSYVGETFFYATMSLQDGVIRLPEITKDEAEGAVIILDTAIRFIEGDENSSQHMKELAKQSFDLIRAGAEDVIVLAHSNKEMMKSSELTLDNAMRGSSELTAFLSSCWATRLQDPEHPYESASLLKHVKPRDFEADPFEVITDRETCRMTFVEGSRGASVAKKTNANADGKEETALDVIRDNPNLSLSKLVLKLKEMGITRSKSWVGEKRYEVHHTGVTTS
jgi:hypothetical protein